MAAYAYEPISDRVPTGGARGRALVAIAGAVIVKTGARSVRVAAVTFAAAAGLAVVYAAGHALFSRPLPWGGIGWVVLPGTAAVLLVATFRIRREREYEELTGNVAELRERLARAEERHRQSETRLSRLSAAVDQSPNAIFITDLQGRIEYVNESFTRITGYTREEAIGQTPGMIKSGQTPQAVYRELWETIRAGDVWSGVMRNRRKNGELYWDSVSISPIRDYRGSSGRYLAVQTDVTEQRNMENALREERNFVNAVLGTSGALILVLDPRGRIERANAACEDSSGLSLEDMLGRPFRDLLPAGAGMDEVAELLEGPRSSRVPRRFDAQCGTGSGPYRTIAWHGAVIEGPGGQVEHVVLTGIDDTDRRAAEARARERETELAHMDRLSLMGEMAAGLAHELNQPLTSIYTYAKACQRMLRDEDASREKLREALEQTARRAEHAGEIIRHFRGFVRKRPPARRRMDLDRVIEDALEFVSGAICSAGIRVALELSSPHSEVWADAVQVEQVLLNLVRNAVDAMQARDGTRRLTISALSTTNGMVEVSVADTGPGVPAQRQSSLFDPFVTSKKDGLGMGLAISRGIVESHGGRLWLDEASGPGATFRFTLPEAE